MNDLIPKYLNGRMSEEEKLQFEKEVEANSELKRELAELSRLFLGIEITEKLEQNHVDSMQLVIYAENPGELDDTTQLEISDHLKECQDCTEEYKICLEVTQNSIVKNKVRKISEKNIIQKIIGFLLPPQMHLRPAVAYFALILLSVTSYYSYERFTIPTPTVDVYTLSTTTLRGETNKNIIEITIDEKYINLEFSMPIVNNQMYDLTISDNLSSPILTFHNQIYNNQFKILVSTDQISEGDYKISVKDSKADSANDEILEVSFTIKIID